MYCHQQRVIDMLGSFLKHQKYLAFLVAAAIGASSCSAVQGYPKDPENNRQILASLQPYFQPSQEQDYLSIVDPQARQQRRDVVVLSRVRAYDIEFDKFEKTLYGSGTGLTTASDLILLVLNGLGATVGGAATKTALAAASTGVVGAQGAVNKDIYYQKTLPGLLAQMEANRGAQKLLIFEGLK
jgi:hypothetical protein